jgi:hypothetical protein
MRVCTKGPLCGPFVILSEVFLIPSEAFVILSEAFVILSEAFVILSEAKDLKERLNYCIKSVGVPALCRTLR